MNTTSIISCDLKNPEKAYQSYISLFSPIFVFPIFFTSFHLLHKHSKSQNLNVRRALVVSLIINFCILVNLATFFYPLLVLPVVGVQVGGSLFRVMNRVVWYLYIGMVLQHATNTVTIFICHYRFLLLSKTFLTKNSALYQSTRSCHKLVCISYPLLISAVFIGLLIFRIDQVEYQRQWKINFYKANKIETIWCPDFLVLDPNFGDFTLLVYLISSINSYFAIMFIVSCLMTIRIVNSARGKISTQTAKSQIYLVSAFFISLCIQTTFILLPLIHFVSCLYSETIKFLTGDYLFYSILLHGHQGTAVVLLNILTHRKTRSIIFCRQQEMAKRIRVLQTSSL